MTEDRYIRLQTLADLLGRSLFSVKRSVDNAGYQVHKVRVAGQWRNAVTVADAEAWKAGLNTPNVVVHPTSASPGSRAFAAGKSDGLKPSARRNRQPKEFV